MMHGTMNVMMKILITRVTPPTCVYIQAFFDQNSTRVHMSGLPYPLTNTLPYWHGTKTNDYVKTANERMVEQIQMVNVTRRPFTALTQSRSATETCNQRSLQPHHPIKHCAVVDSRPRVHGKWIPKENSNTR
jgi:hypothetical protein